MARRIIKVGSLFMLHLYSVKVENNWILLYNQYVHHKIIKLENGFCGFYLPDNVFLKTIQNPIFQIFLDSVAIFQLPCNYCIIH